MGNYVAQSKAVDEDLKKLPPGDGKSTYALMSDAEDMTKKRASDESSSYMQGWKHQLLIYPMYLSSISPPAVPLSPSSTQDPKRPKVQDKSSTRSASTHKDTLAKFAGSREERRQAQ